MTQYTIYCTPEQTRKALKLCAPIELESEYYHPTEHDFKFDNPIPCESFANGYHYAKCPTAEQMCGWLDEQGILFGVSRWKNGDASIYFKEDRRKSFFRVRKSYKEALIAAIDEALDYLIQSVQTNEKKDWTCTT